MNRSQCLGMMIDLITFSQPTLRPMSPHAKVLCFFFSIEKKLTSVGAFQQSTKKLLGGPHIFLGQFQH